MLKFGVYLQLLFKDKSKNNLETFGTIVVYIYYRRFYLPESTETSILILKLDFRREPSHSLEVGGSASGKKVVAV
jgi:hypothetical protein